ncbi:MAG TPA: DUF177 domain-containing protein [Thermoanaerobaculia bacterium]|nr:DUF177 domain-containing protein [Thermoanaerobaculia bacterium]
MQIWLEQVRDEPFAWDETLHVDLEDFESPDVVAVGPVEYGGRLVFAEPGFLLKARLSYEQTLSCTRCLRTFVERMEPEFELLLLPPSELSAAESELGARDLGIWPLEGETFRTEPVAREQVQLNVPMKPLCRPDCQGLCPTCGQDLNAGECSCAAPPDPRWGALAALRERIDKT